MAVRTVWGVGYPEGPQQAPFKLMMAKGPAATLRAEATSSTVHCCCCCCCCC